MATITRKVEVQVVVCDKCGEELYQLNDRGKPPRYVYGVYYGDGDTAYCENTCMPEDE